MIIVASPEEPRLASLNTDEHGVRTNDVEFMDALFGLIDPASELTGRINGVQVVDVTPDSRFALHVRRGNQAFYVLISEQPD